MTERVKEIGEAVQRTADREEYAIGILKVREIIGMMRVSLVPQIPEHIKKVINLRGKVIPVDDL